jgi:hypothetical protein
MAECVPMHSLTIMLSLNWVFLFKKITGLTIFSVLQSKNDICFQRKMIVRRFTYVLQAKTKGGCTDDNHHKSTRHTPSFNSKTQATSHRPSPDKVNNK